MKRIVVELSRSSIDNAVAELKAINKEMKSKCDEVCLRLAQIGAQEAQAHLALAYGNTSATIQPPVKIGNGYKIVMSGEDVYFVEFGTGDQVSPHFDTTVPVAWGSWSAEDKQKLWKYGFWWYGGERLTGTPAYMPMYYAEKAIRANIKSVVKEVFG